MFDNYIGIPFVNRQSTLEACDCYGLVRLIYRDLLKINVPQPIASAFESKHIRDEFLEEISSNWNEVLEPQKFDVVAIARDPRHPKIVQHFGIYIGNGKMIHTLKDVNSHVAKLSDYKYAIKGYFRHG